MPGQLKLLDQTLVFTMSTNFSYKPNIFKIFCRLFPIYTNIIGHLSNIEMFKVEKILYEEHTYAYKHKSIQTKCIMGRNILVSSPYWLGLFNPHIMHYCEQTNLKRICDKMYLFISNLPNCFWNRISFIYSKYHSRAL